MKNFILKVLNFILNIVMVISVCYSIFNIVMTFLPCEIQTQVFGFLNMSKEYVATFSISSTINAVILVASKFMQTYTRIGLTTKLAEAENVINNTNQLNDLVVEKVNTLLNNMKLMQEQNNALLSVQRVTTERNIKASEKLVYKDEKEAYKQALEEIERVKESFKDINNISKVVEKVEVKEVLVEKDELSGRV